MFFTFLRSSDSSGAAAAAGTDQSASRHHGTPVNSSWLTSVWLCSVWSGRYPLFCFSLRPNRWRCRLLPWRRRAPSPALPPVLPPPPTPLTPPSSPACTRHCPRALTPASHPARTHRPHPHPTRSARAWPQTPASTISLTRRKLPETSRNRFRFPPFLLRFQKLNSKPRLVTWSVNKSLVYYFLFRCFDNSVKILLRLQGKELKVSLQGTPALTKVITGQKPVKKHGT